LLSNLLINSMPSAGRGLVVLGKTLLGYRVDGVTSDIRLTDASKRTEFQLQLATTSETKTYQQAQLGMPMSIQKLLGLPRGTT
jgi:hypothetical protein